VCADLTAEFSALSGGRLPVTGGGDSWGFTSCYLNWNETRGGRNTYARGAPERRPPRGRWHRVFDPGRKKTSSGCCARSRKEAEKRVRTSCGFVQKQSNCASGQRRREVRTLFDRARDPDYAEVVKDTRALAKSLRPNAKSEALAEFRVQVARLRKRLAEVVSVDFFGAIGRETAEGLVKNLEARLNEGEAVTEKATDVAARCRSIHRERPSVLSPRP